MKEKRRKPVVPEDPRAELRGLDDLASTGSASFAVRHDAQDRSSISHQMLRYERNATASRSLRLPKLRNPKRANSSKR